MKLSVIVPCYNERETIAEVLSAVRNGPVQPVQIVVVDDASTDGTRERLTGELRGLVDVLLLHERNQGKGAAMRTGIAAAKGELVVIQDADREYDPNEYPLLMSPFESGRADVVYGSRVAGGGTRTGSCISGTWLATVF